MHEWLLILAVLATLKTNLQVASTGDKYYSPVINNYYFNNDKSETDTHNNSNNYKNIINSSNNNNNNNSNNKVNNKKLASNSDNTNAIGIFNTGSNSGSSSSSSKINNYSDNSYSYKNSNNKNQLNSKNIKYNKHNNNNNMNNKNKKNLPDHDTLVEIENSLLTLFGLKKPPTIDRSKVIIPEAMKQLYSEIMGHEFDSVNIPKPGLFTNTANTVRSFMHQGSSIDDRFLHHHKFRLYFNVKSIPPEEQLKAAELILNRDAINTAGANRTRYQIMVYDILRPGVKGIREPSLLLLDTKSVRINDTKSISLDVQPAVDRWLTSPKFNYGLLIEVRTSKHLKPARHNHIRLRRSLNENHEDWANKQPLLFTYTDDGHHKQRSIRDVNNRSKRAHHRRAHRRKTGSETCQRRPLYVDFSDVGWSDWIVAPPGYEAYYCHGDCPFPLAEHLNSTNHAAIQNLVNNINPAKVPKACCIPTQLTAISMLYLNDQNTVVLKNYQDMAVVGCGCR